MKTSIIAAHFAFLLAVPAFAHTVDSGNAFFDKEELRQHLLTEFLAHRKASHKDVPLPGSFSILKPAQMASATPPMSLSSLFSSIGTVSAATPAGNGALMAASFAPFKPKVRYYSDPTTFYVESDNMSDGMPNRMVGITTWQQQVPLPVAWFASTMNPEKDPGALSFGQPNYWRLPLVPTVAATPTPIFTVGSTNNNFQRGAVAFASNGVAIFNPANNTGKVSYEIGELDYYGGHTGLADDYHYHIIPMHLSARFGGPLSDDKPVAWGLDGYPIYGYVEPDGSARQALDTNGGHDVGNGWGYHYHAIGNNTVDANHPYGTPQSPYMMTSFRGTVVNYGGQVDGQPEAAPIRADGTGGYNAKPVQGTAFPSLKIIAFKNPVALKLASDSNSTQGTGAVHLTEDLAGTPSSDSYLMRYTLTTFDGTSNTTANYDCCWQFNRNANPKTVTMTWRAPSLVGGQLSLPMATTTTTYTPAAGTASGNRITTYPLGPWSELKLPDTGQTLDATATFGEDSDYTINPPALTDNGDGTITDTVTGLMWQKVDAGELTWASAVANASAQTTGGYSDWRLPTPAELFSILNHNNNPALDQTKFPNSNSADYWWTSDIYGTDSTKVWCTNAGGGLGPKPITETISAGGTLRYNARYVRGGKPNNSHNYINNNDGTITDADTGLMWTQLPATAMNWNSALSYTENLTLAGYGDWRLPNVKEMQTLIDFTLTNATTTTGIQPSMNRTMFAKTLTNCAITKGSTIVTCDDTTGLLAGMPVVAVSSFQLLGCSTTSGSATVTCSNTTGLIVGMSITGTGFPSGATVSAITPNVSFRISASASATGNVAAMANYIAANTTVVSVTNGTSFVLNGGAANTGTGITLRALALPTAYWTSSSVKSGTLTQAWLVEMGINNSVPAQNGPTRGSQGIISYEIYSAAYPVFAVRNTSVATQISVAQNGTVLTDGVSTVGFSATGTKTFTITNNGITSLILNGVTVDGTNPSNFTLVNAPSAGAVVAANASVSFSVQFGNASVGTTYNAAMHIATSDPSVGAAFDVNLTGSVPVIGSVVINPSVPSNTDTPYITAKIRPPSGTTISQAQLTYSAGSSTTATAFSETFAIAPSNGITGAQYPWTVTTVRNVADMKQNSSTSNNTAPIVLVNCTTNGTTTVTCASTTGLWPGMSITGTNMPTNATISSITNSTTFVISAAATSSGSALTLTVAGVTLAGCSLNTSPTVQCTSTAGLVVGMGISGAGLSTTPPNPTVASIVDAMHFTLSSTTVTAVPATLTASGSAAEFTTGTVNYTDTMIQTTNPISTTGALSGFVEFYVQALNLVPNNGWQFQVSPDGGTTWNTRLSENYTGASAANCTLNSTNNQTTGSTTVLCPNTSGLTVGNIVQGTAISVAGCTTTSGSALVTTANTGSLAVGMFLTGTGSSGIPNGARIISIVAGTSFKMSTNATAGATGTLLANYFNANTTISSITANTSFVVNNAVFYSGSGITVASANHGFKKMHYDLVAGDLSTANMKMRFQFSGYSNLSPTKAATCDIDDVLVSLTTGVPPVTVTMFDDGLHGDGAAGDGVYGVQLPAFAPGTNVTFSITTTDSNSNVTTVASAGTYTTTLPLAVKTTSPLPNAFTSTAYTQTLAATGGSGTGYAWSVTGGSLPPGVTLGTNGTFSGTPTAMGSYSFTATVSDSAGHTASRTFALASTTPPNVLIIVTDDQGWGDIGYHSYPGRVHIDTPNMDSFATSGIRMERFYPTAVCSVTRACLQTGRNTIRTGVNNTRGLDLSEHILPQTFSAAGYQTFITGKWHCGGPENSICLQTVNGQKVRVIQEGDEYRPFNRGWKMHYGEYGVIDAFTHYESSLLNANTSTWLKPDWWLNGVQYADGDATQHTDPEGHGGYATDLLADKATSIITNSKGDRDPSKPLLLYLPFSQVHGPVSAPPSYLAKYGNSSDPTHYISDVPTRTIAASVDCMDVAIGRVFAALDTMSMTNNTLVIFMSDNGGENATGGSDLPLRGAKTEPYDGGIRTPCGIRFPGKLAGGLQVTNCVTTSGTSVTCTSTSGLAAGMALAGNGLAYGTTVASVTDGTHFVLSAAPTTPASGIAITAGVISNMYFWVGDVFPTICAATGVTPLNTKPFDGLNMWPALQSISGANPDGTQTRFQTNPDGSKNTTTTNISPLVTLASPNVAFNTYTDPVSGQTKVFKDIYSPSTSAVILTHCATVTNSTAVTCDSTTGLTAGGSIYGVGIKGNATVTSITDATHFVMSDPPNVAYASITLNVGFPTNQLFNIQDDPYETTDYMLSVNQGGLTSQQITALSVIASSMQASISGINPNVYPPYVGPALITNTATQGSTIQLYVPFTSYAKNPPTINWRKNGVNLTDGTTASGSTISGAITFTQNTTAPDPGLGNPSVPTNGAYNTILTITNVAPGDAGNYDLVISNVDTYQSPNVTNTVISPAGTLSVAVGSPVLAALPAYTKGTTQTLSWAAITNATGYTVQAATDVNFTSIAATQNSSTTSATISGLTNGAQYWFRATATDGVTTSPYSNVVTSTQDASNPVVTITAPAAGTNLSVNTVNVQGTATDAVSAITGVVVNGVAATTADGFAHWSASVSLVSGANTITATANDSASSGGNSGSASITVTLNAVNPDVVSVSTGPTSPTYLDPVTVLAQVQPGAAPITQVQLSYNLGVPVSTTIWREVFANTSSNNWNGTGAINAWTTAGAGAMRQAVSTSNHTAPIGITAAATTSGSTTVTCSSTATLWPGMLITGPNIPGSINGTNIGNTTVASITSGTTFVLSQAATATGTGLSLTAAGVSLTNAVTTAANVTVTCDSTAGLINGMSLAGAGLASNATVASVTGATTFTMNAAPTTAGSAFTITASGSAAEFTGGTANLTDTMFTTANSINTGGSAGYVEFWVQTRDLAATNNCQWAMQISPDGGTTWNTRLGEDWTSKTVNLANVVANTGGLVAGSTTVTCASTSGLVVGQTIAGPNVYMTCGLTNGQSTVTCANTTGLLAGMTLQGTGIPNNTRIGTITANTSFTLVTGTTAAAVNATATNASAAIVATYFPAVTVSSITNSTTFVLNAPAYVNTAAAPIVASATTVNHGFQLFHYDFVGAELGATTKLRWQCTSYTPQAPTRTPRIDVDDILIATTAPPPTVTVTMFDDGLHGDGAAGDGIYGAQIPVQPGGTTVTFQVTATDTAAHSTTSPNTGSYTYAVNSKLTDATIVNAEFLGIPTDQSVSLNVIASSPQDAFMEYGTVSGMYTNTTAVTTFNTPAVNGVFPIVITPTGLSPNTEYYYRLRYRNSGGTLFYARGERSFHTARPRGSPFVFTIFADPHLDVNTYSDPADPTHTPTLLNRALANVASDQPDFHIDLGDILMTDKLSVTDGTGIPSYWDGNNFPNQSIVSARAALFRSFYEQTCHSVPFCGTLGNHEAEYGYLFTAAADKLNNIPAWDLTARKTYFPAPVPSAFYTGNATTKDFTGGSLGLLQDYYAWEWGDALFVVLDPYWNTTTNPSQSNNAWNWSLGQAQYNWLASTLQKSRAPYKFVFLHHLVGGTTTLADGVTSNVAGRGGVEVAPYFEWGGKNLDGTDGFATNRPGWAMPIHSLLVQNKVSVVFHGHDHLYGYQTLDGIVYLECPQPGTANYTQLGSAADGKYTQGVLLPNSGHIRVTVSPAQVTSEYVRAYRLNDENTTTHNRDVSHSFALQPTAYPPVVSASTATLLTTANTVTIHGFGFDPTPTNNSVVFNDGAVGAVTSATATTLTVTFSTKPVSTGSLTAIVTTNSLSSGAAVQVATVDTPVMITTATLPGWLFNQSGYSQTIATTGGTGAVTFSVTAGSLPTGMSLSTSGVLSGTPTEVNTFSFTVTATDTMGATGIQAYTVVISAAVPTVTTPASSSVTGTSASLGGNITGSGGVTISALGVVFSPTGFNANPRIGGAWVINVPGSVTTGTFTVNINDLTPGTAYNFAAYAVNSAGTSYSSVGTFTTLNNNANLSNLTLSSGLLNPTFSSATRNYNVTVPNAATSLTVTPTASDLSVMVQVNTVATASGNASTAIPLNVGSNTVNVVVTAQDGITKTTYTVTVTRAAPYVLVQQPVGTSLVNGASIVDFGGAVPGKTTTTRVFTVKNISGVVLKNFVFSFDGANPGDFILTTLPATTLAIGASSTFAITFKPAVGAVGARSGTMHIDAAGETQNSFNLELTGTGAVQPVITSPPGSQIVGVGATAHLSVAATGGALSYQWLKNGAAVAGATSNAYSPTAALTTAGAYTVKVTNAAGSVTSLVANLGVINTAPASVGVVGGNTLTLTVSAAGPGLTYQWQKGGSNQGNGPDPLNSAGMISGVATAKLIVTKATASIANTYTCIITMPDPQHSGTPKTLPSGAFNVVLTVKPVINTPFVPNPWVVSGTVTDVVTAQNLPTAFTLTGQPAGVTIDSSGHFHGAPTVAVTTPTMYHLVITASNAAGASAPLNVNATVQPFPISVIGGHIAAVDRDAVVNSGMGGLLNFTVAAGGPVTGTLKNGAASYPFTGRLNTAVNAANPDPLHPMLTVAVPKTSLVLVVGFNNIASNYIDGTVTLGTTSSVAHFTGARQVWGGGSTGANPFYGAFTGALQPTSTNTTIPQGDGFLTFTATAAGAITWSGQLADGTVLPTGSSSLGPNGEVPLFASLYSGTGSLLGSPGITTNTRVLTGTLTWSKNAQATTTRAYKAGFGALNPVGLSLLGGQYIPPSKGSAVLANVSPPSSAAISFMDGLADAGISGVAMASSLAQTLTISTENVATLPTAAAGNIANIKVSTINTANGTFAGSLILSDPNPYNAALAKIARPLSFNGVFLQGANNIGTGWFLMPSIAGPPANVTTSPMTSGQVLITPK